MSVDTMSFVFPVTLVASGELTVLHNTMEYVITTPSSDEPIMPTCQPCTHTHRQAHRLAHTLTGAHTHTHTHTCSHKYPSGM